MWCHQTGWGLRSTRYWSLYTTQLQLRIIGRQRITADIPTFRVLEKWPETFLMAWLFKTESMIDLGTSWCQALPPGARRGWWGRWLSRRTPGGSPIRRGRSSTCRQSQTTNRTWRSICLGQHWGQDRHRQAESVSQAASESTSCGTLTGV